MTVTETSGGGALTVSLCAAVALLDADGRSAGKSQAVYEIWKDVKRTHTQYAFFSRVSHPLSPTPWMILFLYAKLNAGVRYVQGMNEVLAPIMFVSTKMCRRKRGGRDGSSVTGGDAVAADTNFNNAFDPWGYVT